MALVYKAAQIEGLASDTKPTTVPTDRKFFETDTGRMYNFNGSSWDNITQGQDAGVTSTHSTTIGDYTAPTAATGTSVDAATTDTGTLVSQTTGSNQRDIYSGQTRAGLKADTGSALIGKVITQVRVRLLKQASPTGTYYVRVRNSSDTIIGTFGSGDVSTLTAGFQNYDFSSYTWTVAEGDRLSVEYTGGDVGNKLNLAYSASDEYDSTATEWFYHTGSYTDVNHDELNFVFTGPTADMVFDDSTATKWQSDNETNPAIYVDCGGSNVNLVGIAIHPHANSTVTEIKIRASTDATFTDSENVRTITWSDITEGSWNYIRFNAVNARYLQIYGTDGGSAILSINEIKYLTKTDSELTQDYLTKTDSELTQDHTHINIDPSATGLALSG
jgi:hypothetical protein